MRELIKKPDMDKIQKSAANQHVKWHFNPTLGPHLWRVYQIMIKTAKQAIYAILASAGINDEELMTAFTGEAALINSRPLTYPNDDAPLTPNHFLHGQMGEQLALGLLKIDEKDFNIKKRWRRIQTDYLNTFGSAG